MNKSDCWSAFTVNRIEHHVLSQHIGLQRNSVLLRFLAKEEMVYQMMDALNVYAIDVVVEG